MPRSASPEALSDAEAATGPSIRGDVRLLPPSQELPFFTQQTSYPALTAGAFQTEIQKELARQCKTRLEELRV